MPTFQWDILATVGMCKAYQRQKPSLTKLFVWNSNHTFPLGGGFELTMGRGVSNPSGNGTKFVYSPCSIIGISGLSIPGRSRRKHQGDCYYYLGINKPLTSIGGGLKLISNFVLVFLLCLFLPHRIIHFCNASKILCKFFRQVQ